LRKDLKSPLCKTPKMKSIQKETRLSLISGIILFLGLLIVNLFWLFYSLLGKNHWLMAGISVFASFLIFVFLVFRGLRKNHLAKDSGEKESDSKEEQKSVTFSQSNSSGEVQKTNEDFRKLKEEFSKTTQALFQRETELIQANKKIQELDAIKSEFVSVAAHQLRTPLTGIKWSYLALLEKETGSLNPEQKKIIEEGLEAIDYAIDTTNDLLNTARLEEGKTTISPEEQPIGPVIQEILKQHEPVIKEKKIKMNIDFPFSSPLSLKFDKEKISIVFDNIFANAVKYTPEGGSIELKAFREKDAVVFKIKDSGIGIPKAEQEKVFSKFFRAKNAVSFQTSGSGLGLYVAKNIVEKHGGEISLESEEGAGTTVAFSLPVK